jgi:hypothetical protein
VIPRYERGVERCSYMVKTGPKPSLLIERFYLWPMIIELARVYHEAGTNSRLLIDGKFLCYAIELPYYENRRNVSCIPEGEYLVQVIRHERFGECLHVLQVPGRSGILFHAANDAIQELRGCIAPVTTTIGQGRGTGSRAAMSLLMQKVAPQLKYGARVTLKIRAHGHP